MGTEAIYRLLPLVVMVGMLAFLRSGTWRDGRARRREERARLRVGLIAELRALDVAYSRNLAALAAGPPLLVPGRGFFSVYRGNLPRLMLLAEPEIAAIVSAHGASELLEATVAGHVLPSPRPVMRVEAQPESRAALTRLYTEARASVAATLLILEREAAAAGSPTGVDPRDAEAAAPTTIWRARDDAARRGEQAVVPG